MPTHIKPIFDRARKSELGLATRGNFLISAPQVMSQAFAHVLRLLPFSDVSSTECLGVQPKQLNTDLTLDTHEASDARSFVVQPSVQPSRL